MNVLVLALTAISAVFEAGTSDNKNKLFFDNNGIVSRTLDLWRDMLNDADKLIESLRAELFKWRAKTQKALVKKQKAESGDIHATL